MNRNNIIAEARDWIGTPYHHQACLKAIGCDCLGLVRGIYRALYGPEPIRVPPYAQYGAGEGERLIDALREHLRETATPQPGDILVFRLRERHAARHCGVLIEPKKFVHAVSARNVCTAALSPWWETRIAAAFTFPDVQ